MALKTLGVPNVAAGVDAATIQKLLFDQVKSMGVTKLAVAADRQLLRLTVDFDRWLTADDLPKDSNKRALVTALAPHVVGELDVYLSAAISVSNTPLRVLFIKLLPAVNRVRIDSLTVKGHYDVTAAADSIALILNRYADNLSGALSISPFMSVTLPATIQDSFDPSSPIKIALAPDVKAMLKSRPVKSPFRIEAATLLIDGDKLVAIASLVPINTAMSQTDLAKGSFDEVKVAFRKSLQAGLGIDDPPAGGWAALAKGLLARAIESTFAQSQPCLYASGPIPKENFSAKIPTPDGTSIDCTPNIDCTPTKDCTPKKDCTQTARCDLHVDRRDCGRCKPRPIWGGCWIHYNDLTCEAAKAAQNKIYEGAKAVCEGKKSEAKGRCEANKLIEKAACETAKSMDKDVCEGKKTAKKDACEAMKTAVIALHRTGNIGNLDGGAEGSGSLNLCLKDVHIGAELDKINLTLSVSGSAAIGTHFKFTPLDVGGHILCPFEWTADKNINTTIPPQSIGVNMTLKKETVAGDLAYRGKLDELPIKLHFQPSPLSLVLQNANFYLACPVAAGLVNGLTLGLGPFIPEFLKDYTYHLPATAFYLAPDPPTQQILGHSINPKLSDTPLALIVAGTP